MHTYAASITASSLDRSNTEQGLIIKAEQITNPIAHHGEGPFWDSHTQRLMLLDVLAGAAVAIEDTGIVQRYDLPSPVATVVRRRAKGGFVIAAEREILVCDKDFTEFETISVLSTNPSIRSNDGGCDKAGAFIIGTMSYDATEGQGSVHRISAGRQNQEILPKVTISNGVQWSSDGERVFYIDTPTRRVDVFKVDTETGEWFNQQHHIVIEEHFGLPDGMAIDVEGGLWVALWGGGAVNHYDPSGRLVESILVPGVTQVSSCAFGGSDSKVLYITTSRQGIPDDQEPAAGAVFAVEVVTPGADLFEFSG
jgi:sugar lactone lactonase YvrE